MFSIIFCQVSMRNNVKQSEKQPKIKGSSCSQLKVYISLNETVSEIAEQKFCMSAKRRGSEEQNLAAQFRYL